MEVNSTTTNGGATKVDIVDSDKTGFAGLGSDDFMKLLLAQLQNQDPSEPTSNEALLNQLSSMRSLSANIELGDTLKEITSNQQLSDSAQFLGSFVTGNNEDNESVSGVVERAVMREGTAYLGIGSEEIPVRNVSQVDFVFPSEG